MNNVTLMGRLVKDNELLYTKNTQTEVLKNTIAVRRDYKNAQGEYDTDFIYIEAFGKTADYLYKYSKKGNRVLINGSIRVENYETQTGEKRSITKININKAEVIDFQDTETPDAAKGFEYNSVTDDDVPF